MNILTFDIEDWFHILDNNSTKTEKQWYKYEYRLESNIDRILELLERNKQKATFFSLGWAARKFPQILKKINSYGYEIGTHSDIHQLVYEQNKDEFRQDLDRSIKSIEDVIGVKVKYYRAPGFSIKKGNTWAFEELVKHGIEVDCSVFPAKRAHGGFDSYELAEPHIIVINGLELKEFPVNPYKFGRHNIIFSGGGYFRLLPYYMIKYMMKKSKYVMTYFHPRDFDKDQPIIKELSIIRKFKSYYGLKGAFEKLKRLIKDFEFIDLGEAIKRIDWDKVKKIQIRGL